MLCVRNNCNFTGLLELRKSGKKLSCFCVGVRVCVEKQRWKVGKMTTKKIWKNWAVKSILVEGSCVWINVSSANNNREKREKYRAAERQWQSKSCGSETEWISLQFGAKATVEEVHKPDRPNPNNTTAVTPLLKVSPVSSVVVVVDKERSIWNNKTCSKPWKEREAIWSGVWGKLFEEVFWSVIPGEFLKQTKPTGWKGVSLVMSGRTSSQVSKCNDFRSSNNTSSRSRPNSVPR